MTLQDFKFDTPANRLMYVRTVLLGMDKKTLAETLGDISVFTIRAWERENHGAPLTIKGAEKLVAGFEKLGICCDKDWLLYGTGTTPYKFSKLRLAPNSTVDDDFAVLKETESFRALHPTAVFLINVDEKMEPKYLKGEILAGIPSKDIDIMYKCLGKVCIVQTQDYQVKLLRKVTQGSKEGLFFLETTNPEFAHENFETPLDYAAPVIWQRVKC